VWVERQSANRIVMSLQVSDRTAATHIPNTNVVLTRIGQRPFAIGGDRDPAVRERVEPSSSRTTSPESKLQSTSRLEAGVMRRSSGDATFISSPKAS
jgi:hypothetical protein